MFAKLLKHEFRSTGRTLGLLSIAALLAGVFGFIISLIAVTNESISDSKAFDVIVSPIYGIIILGLVAYIFSSAIIPYKQFYKSKFTDEGYLAFTLPVTSHQILLSSILNLVLWSIITVFVLAVSILLLIAPVLASSPSYLNFTNYLHTEIDGVEILLGVLYSISSTVYSLMLPFVAITIGSLIAKKRKLGAAFCIGYGINMVVSFISSILLILEGTWESMQATYIIEAIHICFMLLLGVGGYFLMHYLINKKMNL